MAGHLNGRAPAAQGLRAAPGERAPAAPRARSRAWLPVALLSIGGAVGLALWAKWGFLIAFDTIRAYCF